MTAEKFLLHINDIAGPGLWPEDSIEEYKKTWLEIQLVYSSFKFKGLIDLGVNIDWEPLVKHTRKGNNDIPNRVLHIEIEADCDKSNIRTNIAYHLDLIMVNIFLTANISCPGCMNLYQTYYTVDQRWKHKFDFSNGPFEDARYLSKELHGWPHISRIPLIEVVTWYETLGLGVKQLAYTNLEKTLFALLNFCQDDNVLSPNSIIWLMHALEAFYDTPKDKVNTILRERIMLFLGEPEWGRNNILKRINDLYDKRSKYVHGDKEGAIHHPLYNDLFDERMDGYCEGLRKQYEFASAIIVSSVQRLVREGWKDISFEHKEFIRGGK